MSVLLSIFLALGVLYFLLGGALRTLELHEHLTRKKRFNHAIGKLFRDIHDHDDIMESPTTKA